MEIRESQIEDILVHSPSLSKKILHLDAEPSLLTRQMYVPSGRLDLLYSYHNKILLVELKIIGFQQKFVEQVLNYKKDLTNYQSEGKFLKGEILPFLLCTSFSENQRKNCMTNGVLCVNYSPEEILQYFYQHFKPVAYFTEMKPIDIGIWNIHLVHDIVYNLEITNSVNTLKKLFKGSSKTVYNKIKFAYELRLINWIPNQDKISLTQLGQEYISHKDEYVQNHINESQAEILRNYVMRNPYESSIILGIASIVEAVFTLAKNMYPVKLKHLLSYFSYHAGKHFDWKTEKAKFNATKMYSNYAVNLGLLAKTGDVLYLTPEGFRFTMQMQLHKSLKIIGSLKLA